MLLRKELIEGLRPNTINNELPSHAKNINITTCYLYNMLKNIEKCNTLIYEEKVLIY